MADKASKSRDAAMVRSGAALALSVLPHAAALNPNEIQRAIQQCKEQHNEMLEKACEAVENAAAGKNASDLPGISHYMYGYYYFCF